MESNKNSFENLKLLFNDVLDALIESNSVLLQQVEDLKSEVGILTEALALYKDKIQRIEERVTNISVSEEIYVKDLFLENEVESVESQVHQELHQEGKEDEEILFTIDDKYIEQGPEQEPQLQQQAPQLQSQMTDSIPPVEFIDIEIKEDKEEEREDKDESVSGVLFPDLYAKAKPSDKETKLIMDTVKPEWYDWEVDYPAPYVEDIASAIGFNDRLVLVKDLFDGNQDKLMVTIEELNRMELFSDAVDYIRANFSNWDEQSNQVYRFYMIVRRKLRK